MPDRLGKYEILRLLGQGAMGEVYLAKDPVLNREVAIKTIKPGGTFGEEVWARFRHEARVVGGLNHPNVVTVFDFGEDEGVHYLVMEYVPGKDLEHLIKEKVQSKADLIELLIQSLEGLAAAHSKGIVHRDIKPANILVRTEGRRWIAKLTDFGVAKTEGTALTQDGSFMGTLHYMAPEYIDSGKATAKSDLWAFGVMLFEIISAGRKPWPGNSPGPILGGILKDQPAPLVATDWEGLPTTLRAVVKKALMKDPRERYENAQAFATALEECFKSATVKPALVSSAAAAALSPALTPTIPPAAPLSMAEDKELGTDRLLKVGKGGQGQWLSLRVAVRQAPPGARVLVMPGLYLESLVIDRDIHFVATRPGDVILDGGSSPAVVMAGGRAIFEGFQFRCAGASAPVLVQNGSLEIADGKLQSGAEAAIDVVGGSAMLMRTDVGGPAGVGLRVADGHLRAHDVRISGHPGGGVELTSGAVAQLEDTLIEGCGFAGLIVLDGATVDATRCRFIANEMSGVHVHHGAKAHLVDCEFTENKSFGLSALKGAEATLTGCSIGAQGVAPYILGRGAAAPVLESCNVEGQPANEP
jgi:predicted Ser/Thr protein kinase